MKDKLGVFICACGENIAGTVDVDELKKTIGEDEDVAFVADHALLCAGDGKAFLKETIEKEGLDRVVIAACSPKDHEAGFQKVLAEAGRNKYLLQLANIREHCTWVTKDKEEAQGKSLAMVKAAIRRVHLHEQLVEKEIEANSDVLIVGGGIAGMEAALLAAKAGRQVTLVEKSASIGGTTTQYEEVAPAMECAPCMLSPRLDEVSESDNIEVLTCSEATEILGYLGNFQAKVKTTARLVDEDTCLGCDECIQACPVSVLSDYQHGLGDRKAIYVPFPGSVPNCAVIDKENCLRFKGETCTACADACPLEAVDFAQKDEVQEIEAGSVILATGYSTYDPKEDKKWGFGDNAEVYTMTQLERLASNHGPTGGRIEMKNGETPKSIALVHCVGRGELGYCSGVCCQSAMKTAALLRGCSEDKGGDTNVVHLHTDLVTTGWLGQALREKATKNGASFIHTTGPKDMKVEHSDKGATIQYKDVTGQSLSIEADMVVLACGMTPSKGTQELAKMLDLTTDDTGFVAPDHPLLRPAEASLEGVMVAGCASGPKTITDSVSQAKAAAGASLSKVQPGKKLPVEVIVAHAHEERCSKCMVCVTVCPYRAVIYDQPADRVEVNEVLCHGCGTCVASCASGAAEARQFTDAQLDAEIKEVLHV